MTNDQATVTEDRIRRATSADGTELAATVHGTGPGLVLLPAGPGDAETTWSPVLRFLTEHFTCHLLDTRGRGRSGDHPDHSPERQIDDISAFVESLDEPVGLVEWGSFVGAAWSVFAANRSPDVYAVATYDPLPMGVASEEDGARLEGILERVGSLVAQDRLDEAARRFPLEMAEDGFYTEPDMAGGATTEFWAASTENIPMFFGELDQADEGKGPNPADPAQLAKVRVPVLLLHGARSHSMNVEFVRFMEDHLPRARTKAVADAGHYGPRTHPEAVAGKLAEFFKEVRPAA